MNYQELVDKIVKTSHRKDLAATIPLFVEDARTKINDRLGLELAPFLGGTETNEVLDNHPLLYFYPAMQALYEYIVEFEGASYYHNLFIEQADAFHVTATGTTPLVITPEEPTP